MAWLLSQVVQKLLIYWDFWVLELQKTTTGVTNIGYISYNSHNLTKIGQQKFAKMLLGLMSLNFCCNIQTVRSEFGENNMKAA